MAANPSPARARPRTLLDIIKSTLGSDEDILGYLPANIVCPHAGVRNVPYRIELGTLSQVTVYAYSSSAEPQRIPEMVFQGVNRGGAPQKFRLEEVLAVGVLSDALGKDFTPSSLRSLLIVSLFHFCRGQLHNRRMQHNRRLTFRASVPSHRELQKLFRTPVYLRPTINEPYDTSNDTVTIQPELTHYQCLFILKGAAIPASSMLPTTFYEDIRRAANRYRHGAIPSITDDVHGFETGNRTATVSQTCSKR
jgi:hypothetical protein